MGSQVTINGKSYFGNNISVSNNKVYIDGKEATPGEDKVINISIEGNVESLSVDGCDHVTVSGSAGSVKTLSGNVNIKGDVSGDANTMSGNLSCGNVGGSVKTMSGNIRKN